MCKILMKEEFGIDLDSAQDQCAFVGDSPNDEPMFEYFNNSFAVANVQKFSKLMKGLPKFIASQNGGHGFVEISEFLSREGT